MSEADYLIVGQGLAGSVLACLLAMRSRKFIIIDDAHASAASKSAAGIINPITGKRLNRPLLIDEMLQSAFEFYPQAERLLGHRFFYSRKVLRLLQSVEEQRCWTRRLATGEYHRYVADQIPSCSIKGYEFGGFEIGRAAQLDVPKFLDSARDYFIAANSLVERRFEYSDIKFCSNGVQWCEFRSPVLVFCEGYKLKKNPFFGGIEMNPAKGEMLTFRSCSFADDRIVQRGKWIFRNQDGLIKAGTTYSWDLLDEMPTALGRAEILKGLEEFADFRFEIVGQTAGVRPVVRADNRPVVGSHPEHRALAILNGLGSKGALQAPCAADQLVDHLENGKPIRPEFDVCRNLVWKQRVNA